ncbi:MAG: IS701 family transposase [Candidatus Aminicenantes bacterium]|nr:IS701 family transposase [Candidatus Aminicenantes bacterium]
MDIRTLTAVRKHLDSFVGLFDDCFRSRLSRSHMHTYLAGQVSDLERKSVAPIALEAGVPPRSLQEFLEIHRWDHEKMGRRVQELVMIRHGDENAIGLIDETSFPKKGKKTTAVKRQYCGAKGKMENCVVSVHLGYAANDFQTLIGGDLYLPEEWLSDPDRCREAGVPEGVVYRSKWRIALDLLQGAKENGVHFKYVTADETYGRPQGFRDGVAALGFYYVVEIPCSLRGWTRRPQVVEPGEDGLRPGPRRVRPGLVKGWPRARRVDALWKRGGPSWEAFHIKNTQKGPVVWEARLLRFFPSQQGVAGEECWLMIARNLVDQERKYFYSNAPADTAAEELLHVAFSRQRIEELFEESKGEVGLDHFEVRHYRPLVRHLILSMVSLLFLAEQVQHLRGKKSVVEHPPSA